MRELEIEGTGVYLPSRVVTNEKISELNWLVQGEDHWVRLAGIQTRRMGSPEETVANYSLRAARRALEAANYPTIDNMIVIKDHDLLRDDEELGIGPLIGECTKLKKSIPDPDVNIISYACGSFTAAIQMARHSQYEKSTLIVGGLKYTPWVLPNPTMAGLFGEAGAAVVLHPADDSGFVSCFFETIPGTEDFFGIGAISSFPSLYNRRYHTDPNQVVMVVRKSRQAYHLAKEKMVESGRRLLSMNDLVIDDIDYLIPHQANMRLILSVISELGFNRDRTYTGLVDIGNMSGLAPMIATHEVFGGLQESNQKEEIKILYLTVGRGMNKGGALYIKRKN